MKSILPSLLAVTLGFAGCATTDSLYTVGGAGAGGAVGNLLSDGDPLITAASAAGGALLTEGIVHQVKRSQAGAQKAGYQKGRSDAVKQQYWIVQNLQRESTGEPPTKTTFIPVTIEGKTQDGETTVPTTHYIRIEE